MATDRALSLRNRRDGPSGPNKRTNHLFVIGIDRYLGFPNLYNAVKDAQDLVNLLSTRYDFQSDHIYSLYNEQASKRNILQQLKALRSLTERDNLIIYFSGHGGYDKALNAEGFLVPAEANDELDCLGYNSLIRNISNIGAADILLVVDACFSGSVFSSSLGNFQRPPGIGCRWLLTSGRLELVSDGKPGDNSPFARSLLRHLRRNELPDLNSEQLFGLIQDDLRAAVDQEARGESIQSLNPDSHPFTFRLRHAELRVKIGKRERDRTKSWFNPLARRRVDREQLVKRFKTDIFRRRELPCQHFFLLASREQRPRSLLDRLVLELAREKNEQGQLHRLNYPSGGEKAILATHELPVFDHPNYSREQIKTTISSLFDCSVDKLEELHRQQPQLSNYDYVIRAFVIKD